MDKDLPQKGAEEARSQLPSLLDAAERGETIVITRHGKPVAALVPISALRRRKPRRQETILALRGSGRGLWGPDSRKTIRALKDEWER